VYIKEYAALTNWPTITLLERFHLGLSEREKTMASDSEEVLKKRADASFRKEERVKDGKEGAAAYEAESRAVAAKTARLRALRLAKETVDKMEEAAKPVKPATKKRSIRPLP
jgi:hypothetical protein